jgi:hypothetical protein
MKKLYIVVGLLVIGCTIESEPCKGDEVGEVVLFNWKLSKVGCLCKDGAKAEMGLDRSYCICKCSTEAEKTE